MVRVHVLSKTVVGPQAGHVISKALKTRDPSDVLFKPGSLRDPTLNIDVADKQLTDEGLAAFIGVLIKLLKYRDQEYPHGIVKLQELHLQGNLLTIYSLHMLAELIALSAHDLRELDLSNNDIMIHEYKTRVLWESFLTAFSNCFMLRKVDFSKNNLGVAGVDIFTRVYTQMELDFVDMSSSQEMRQQEGSGASDFASRGTATQKSSHRRKSSYSKDIHHYACTRGLQSIPYIILSNVNMDNANIVYLAEIIKIRRTPEQLLEYLPKAKHPSLPDGPGTIETKGIYWQPNGGLSDLSLRLMDMVATVYRNTTMHEDFECLNLENNDDGEPSYNQLKRRQERKKLEEGLHRLEKCQRIQAVELGGIDKVALWKYSIKLLMVARAILLDDRRRPNPVDKELSTAKKNIQPQFAMDEIEPPAPRKYGYEPTVPSRTVSPGVMVSSWQFDPETSTFDFSFPAQHGSSPAPVQHPTMPDIGAVLSEYDRSKMSTRPAGRFGWSSQRLSERQQSSLVHHPAWKRHTDKPYRFEYALDFPLHVWARIILSSKYWTRAVPLAHCQRIIKYAADWDALAVELSVSGSPDHQQIWKILDNIRCFTYSPTE